MVNIYLLKNESMYVGDCDEELGLVKNVLKVVRMDQQMGFIAVGYPLVQKPINMVEDDMPVMQVLNDDCAVYDQIVANYEMAVKQLTGEVSIMTPPKNNLIIPN